MVHRRGSARVGVQGILGTVLYGVLGVAMVMGRLRIGHMYQLTGALCMVLLVKRWYVDGDGGYSYATGGLRVVCVGGGLA